MIWRSRRGFVVDRNGRFLLLDHVGALLQEHPVRRVFDIERRPHVSVTFIDRDELKQRLTSIWDHVEVGIDVLDTELVEDASDQTREMLRALVGLHVPESQQLAPAAPGDPTVRILQRLAELDHPQVEPVRRDGVLVRYSMFDSLEHLGRDVERTKLELMERDGELCEQLLVWLLTIALEHPSEAALTAYVRACLLLMEKPAPDIDETWLPVEAPQLAAPVAELVDDLDEVGATAAADAMETCAVLLGLRGTWAS